MLHHERTGEAIGLFEQETFMAKPYHGQQSPGDCGVQERPAQLERPLCHGQRRRAAGPDALGIATLGLQDLIYLDEELPTSLDRCLLSPKSVGPSGRLYTSSSWHSRSTALEASRA